MLKKEYKIPWLKKLRSGRYKQINGRLRKYKFVENGKSTLVRGYCCIGVLCTTDPEAKKAIDDMETSLDSEYLEKFGLTEEEQDILMKMNDQQGKSFKEIADYIEKNL
jgi:hypothetical protein